MSSSILLFLLFLTLSISSSFGRRRFIPPLYDENTHGTPLTLELLEQGYLRRSNVDGGYPRVSCWSRKLNKQPFLEECEIGPTTRGSVGCFTVWDNEGGKIQQGCLRGQDISLLAQCQKRECRVNPSLSYPHGMNFCCCFGDECNAVDSN